MSASEIISRDDLTHTKLVEIYTQAYMDAELDEDGEIKLELDGYQCFAFVAQEQNTVRFWTAFRLAPKAKREKALDLCNRINSELVILRAACTSGQPLAIVFDHYLVTKGGVTGREIIEVTRRFRSILDSILPLDTDELLA